MDKIISAILLVFSISILVIGLYITIFGYQFEIGKGSGSINIAARFAFISATLSLMTSASFLYLSLSVRRPLVIRKFWLEFLAMLACAFGAAVLSLAIRNVFGITVIVASLIWLLISLPAFASLILGRRS